MVYRWEERPSEEPSDDEAEDDETTKGSSRPHNAFRNDGSFLETFKKLQEAQAQKVEPPPPTAPGPSVPAKKAEDDPPKPPPISPVREKKAVLPSVGKRRGGRVLPTGRVKKAKTEEPGKVETPPSDAWSLYLAEVKRYKETTCEEDGKTRPLVK